MKILTQKGCKNVYLDVLSLIVGLKFDVMVELLLEKTRCLGMWFQEEERKNGLEIWRLRLEGCVLNKEINVR